MAGKRKSVKNAGQPGEKKESGSFTEHGINLKKQINFGGLTNCAELKGQHDKKTQDEKSNNYSFYFSNTNKLRLVN